MKVRVEKELDTAHVLLVGNPNVGKSALFGALSGRYVEVSNYPGTTVDYSAGWMKIGKKKTRIYDSPGADTLSPVSEDEKVTRDLILNNPDSKIIFVIDSKNIKRGLILLSQLAEFGRKVVVVLNMADEARSAGININGSSLSVELGVPVVSTIATEGKGIANLKTALSDANIPNIKINFSETINDAATRISMILGDNKSTALGLSYSYLSGDNGIPEKLNNRFDRSSLQMMESIKESIQLSMGEPLGFAMAKARSDSVQGMIDRNVEINSSPGHKVLRKVGQLATHPFWGIPILLLILTGLYYFVGVFGAQTLVGFFEENIFGNYVIPFFEGLFARIPSEFINDLFIGDFGIISMAITYALALILPIVTTFFLAFGALEDSGYLPRLAFMVDRIFKRIGLNGRAVLPMILGLGCDTMAVLTTRILNTKKEKVIVTLLLALAVPCSAQLGVTLGILGSISFNAVLIWLGVIIGVMLLVGYLSSKVIPGRSSEFILEIPPLRLPKLKNVVIKTLMRLEWYLKEAVPLFILGTVILFILDKLHLLKAVERAFSPIVSGVLGLPASASEAFILGFLRRDYGAAGFKMMYDDNMLDPIGAIVAMTTITLFVPCIANFFVMIKERGYKTAIAMVVFIVPFAVITGGLLNFVLRNIIR